MIEMSGGDYGTETYGERFAEIYDQWYDLPAQTEAAVEFFHGLSRFGPALELGIGTGRIALPLAERGVPVYGIDISEAMVARLRSKPGGENLPVIIGNFAEVPVEGTFALIFTVFCTFFQLLSQDEQVRCFQNVARHLSHEGVFVIEAFGHYYPDQFRRGQKVEAAVVDGHQVVLDLGRYDAIEQRGFMQYLVFDSDGMRMYPSQVRYATPAELDLMARLAGLRLRERWGGWQREPFTIQSRRHVSVYERAALA